MRRARLAIALVALLASPAAAQFGGCPTGTVRLKQGTSSFCASLLDFAASDFLVTISSTGAAIALSATVTKLGSCIGEPTDWCGTVTPANKVIDFGDATSFEIKNDTTTTPTTSGQVVVRTDLNELCVGVNGVTKCVPIARPLQIHGGRGTLGDWSYAGQVAACNTADTACSRTICKCGTCSGSEGSGTCTLPPNSLLDHSLADTATTLCSVHLPVASFTLSGGTVTIGTPCGLGSNVRLRVAGNVAISGGTIDLRGKGGLGASGSAACASSNVGKAGGTSTLYPGGIPGAAGNNAGSAGTNATAPSAGSVPPAVWATASLVGTGGGAPPASGQAGAVSPGGWGGTGGGGGGCAASCSGTIGAGGRGGGGLNIEVGGDYTCTGATIDVRGADGTTGGGAAGGSGAVHVSARTIGTNTCTYSTGAASAGASPPTNCGAGAAGGTGWTLFETGAM